MNVGRASCGCGDGGKDGGWRTNASLGTLVMVVVGTFGMFLDWHCVGKCSRLTNENGTMGSCVVPRDPNRLLEENEV